MGQVGDDEGRLDDGVGPRSRGSRGSRGRAGCELRCIYGAGCGPWGAPEMPSPLLQYQSCQVSSRYIIHGCIPVSSMGKDGQKDRRLNPVYVLCSPPSMQLRVLPARGCAHQTLARVYGPSCCHRQQGLDAEGTVQSACPTGSEPMQHALSPQLIEFSPQ